MTVNIFFLIIKLVVAFYLVRGALRRNDGQMALAHGIAWLGIMMMSFYSLVIPGALIGTVGVAYMCKLTMTRVEQPLREFRGRFRELRGSLDGDVFLTSTQIKKPKKEISQREVDEKYKKEKWK